MDPRNSQAAGPGAITEETTQPGSLLDGASEYEYVTIFNPLDVEFIGQVGQSKPVNMPFQIRRDEHSAIVSTSAEDVTRNYGLNLKNKDHIARMPIINKVHIPAGQTRNILGNEAQVIVRQLVTEILQRRKKRLMLADPHQRRLVEAEIIKGRQSVADILGGAPVSMSEQVQTALSASNEQLAEEVEFPGVNNEPERQPDDSRAPTGRGRQPKAATA